MGVKSLSVLNNALLCKWSWHFATERGAFWNQVIQGKYGKTREGQATQEVKEGCGVGLWKAKWKDWDLMRSQCSFVVGNGRRVLFWKDRWFGDNLLCALFPSSFALSLFKDAWVENVWNFSIEKGGWGLESVFL